MTMISHARKLSGFGGHLSPVPPHAIMGRQVLNLVFSAYNTLASAARRSSCMLWRLQRDLESGLALALFSSAPSVPYPCHVQRPADAELWASAHSSPYAES
ncbi:hypothetical protein AXG93_4031s1060 [Marchantia polymorpha subsp. ruderalis]|uniref:Uncharacterized protein n=1 Tax=Marchantia polymorpha subsp. ruderalis TaxID=1480154 RepID=A0A176WFZ6_MARPO|nr:hypothetical protein AXG93_4031s1060 [Marchantia polymorpha subsp. ruderalis]